MVVLDTNAVLRFILQDIEEMADQVEEQIKSNPCLVPMEVVAEVVYVLNKTYQIPRNSIQEAVLVFLSNDGVYAAQYSIVVKALEVFASTKFDFVDCAMAGYLLHGHDIFTFDKKLKRYLHGLG